jgi:tRNA G18 (ribose-2'-O)-methylase SpoU
MGELLHLPWAVAERWPGDLELIRSRGFSVIAMTPSTAAVDLFDIKLDSTARRALLFGAEGSGLTSEALAASDVRARIPMRAGVDSLNVGHAAAIALAHLGVVEPLADPFTTQHV